MFYAAYVHNTNVMTDFALTWFVSSVAFKKVTDHYQVDTPEVLLTCGVIPHQ